MESLVNEKLHPNFPGNNLGFYIYAKDCYRHFDFVGSSDLGK
jgi:hypothetical protein